MGSYETTASVIYPTLPLPTGHTGPLNRGGNDSIGLPLGNLTSQLFANVYMNPFDQWAKHTLKAQYYIRYADDFVFLSEDRQSLRDMLPCIQTFLQDTLALTLHPNKIDLKTFASGVDFLGWVHFSDHRVLRAKTKQRMLKKIKCLPEEATLQSYLGLLCHGNAARLIQRVRGWWWLWRE